MEILALSSLQHYAYCPRQFALIHIEQAWADNFFTAEGIALHNRVDSGLPEQRGLVRSERNVEVFSDVFGIRGKLDLLEITKGAHKNEPLYFLPVEYKRGKSKIENWDRIQLCAQAICIEEMREVKVASGAIWYWQERRREFVDFDEELRNLTISSISEARDLLLIGKTPSPTNNFKKCKACSLVDLCQPTIFQKDLSGKYLNNLFESSQESNNEIDFE